LNPHPTAAISLLSAASRVSLRIGDRILFPQLRKLGFLAIVCIVALRLAVGWHFYKAGVAKFKDRNWTSAGFLSGAQGPLAGWFHGFAPLPDATRLSEEGVIQIWSVYRDSATSGYEYESPDFLQPLEEQVALAEAQVKAAETPEDKRSAEETLRTAKERLAAFRRQAKDAEAVFQRRQGQLKHFFQSNREDIDDYLRELAWLESLKADSAADVPFQEQRIAAKEAEVRAKARTLMGGLEQLNESLERDYYNLATPEQRRGGVIRLSGSDSAMVDKTVKWLVLLVGVCLILGLFTRPAAVAGSLFLASVLAVSGWPFWSGGNEEALKVAVELFALLTLAAVGAGRFAGLDFFLYALWAKFVGGPRTAGEQT
jgi:uncharacterized membrane protein YphA (DoxX/SURF4 family)